MAKHFPDPETENPSGGWEYIDGVWRNQDICKGVTYAGDGDYHPFTLSVEEDEVYVDEVSTLVIAGGNFQAGITTVLVTGQTVDNISIDNTEQITVTMTPTDDTQRTLDVANGLKDAYGTTLQYKPTILSSYLHELAQPFTDGCTLWVGKRAGANGLFYNKIDDVDFAVSNKDDTVLIQSTQPNYATMDTFYAPVTDSRSDLVSTGYNIDSTNDWSLTFMVKNPDPISQYNANICLGSSLISNGVGEIEAQHNVPNDSFDINHGATVPALSWSTAETDTLDWLQVSFVKDALSNTLRASVNGISKTHNSSTIYNHVLYLYNTQGGGSFSMGLRDASLADVRLYDRQLTETEISTYHSQTVEEIIPDDAGAVPFEFKANVVTGVGSSTESGGNGAFNSGCLFGSLEGDGELEFTCDLGCDMMVGFDTTYDGALPYATLEWSIHVAPTNIMYVFQSGSQTFNGVATVAIDNWKIRRTNTLIEYIKNDVVVYTSLIAATGTIYPKVLHRGVGKTVENIKLTKRTAPV